MDWPPSRSSGDDDRTPPSASTSVKGWDLGRLPDGSWDSFYEGHNPKPLPQELVGPTITVRARSGKSWNATIT